MSDALNRTGVAGHSAPASDATGRLIAAIDAVNRVVLGKTGQVELAFASLLAGGHLLIEDLPGVGKTTLAHAIAIVTGGRWQRIQFTNDLLPADIVGVSIWRSADERFEFRPGPVFANVVLADEINRATPRTQSALLEAMAEQQVSVDGHTHALPKPFFVIATQNPLDLVGTYPLPDSQLDRFLLRISLGYPDPAQERALLTQPDRREILSNLLPILSPEDVLTLRGQTEALHVSEPVLDYVQALVQATREHAALRAGLSPRAALALLRTARAHALLQAQDFVLPDNVKQVFPALAMHRLQCRPNTGETGDVVDQILDETRVP
ncbi:MAG: MoxR family ATPase [Wenzhouxiangellaceae bacterium]|nr:MoxR family ATPase [Wenzhouxiangellaceae bacterium]